MCCTPNLRLRFGLSSALTFTTSILPAQVCATSSSTGSMTSQGLLHGAQNATSTGLLDCKTCDSKFASPTNFKLKLVFMFSTGVRSCQTLLHAPCQRGCELYNSHVCRYL